MLQNNGSRVHGICDRCNNINSALTGVDVSGIILVDPPLHNPSIKGIIFNVDGLENPTIDWIDTYKEVSCMSKFDETTWSSFSKYIFGATQSHSANMNFQTNPESDVEFQNESSDGDTDKKIH